MNTLFFDDYPGLDELFRIMRENRCIEILNYLKNKDEKYSSLIKSKSEQSMRLRNNHVGDVSEFDKYMDIIHEQENYEIDMIYSYAFFDAISALKKLNIL